MTVNVVETKKLNKYYGGFKALKDLNLTIEEGSIYGFIGPNGAGKTTTLKILATLLSPSSGIAKVCGISVFKYPEEIRPLIGYMPDFFGVYDDMKVWEYMDFFGAAFKIEKAKRASITDDLLSLVGLEGKKYAYVESLSRGMKQRLCLARALIHDPKLLILDEPASGLDPRARVEMRELLKELKRMGKTIIVSSHILPELSELCTHIGIIEKGNLLVSGRVDEIVKSIQTKKVIRVRILDDNALLMKAAVNYGNLASLDELEPGTFLAELSGEDEVVANFLTYLIQQGIKVVSYYEEPADLEDIFFKITKGAVQ